jgi:hypothetical protein
MTTSAQKRFSLLCTLDNLKTELDKPFVPRPGSDPFSVNFQREMYNEMVASMRPRYHAAASELVDLELKKHRRQMAAIHRRCEARRAQLPKAA